MTTTPAAAPPTRTWMVAVASAPALVVGLLVTVVLVVLLSWPGLLLGVVVTAGLTVYAWSRASTDPTGRVLAALAARPVDPAAEARLVNLVDGLSLTGGVTPPTLHVVDVDARNLLVLGIADADTHLVATRGLLDALERIELEAVLARALVLVRRGDLVAATTAVQVLHGGPGGATPLLARPVAGVLRRRLAAEDPGADIELDRDAAGLTRYPPGLIGALRRLDGATTTVPGADAATEPLWLADPTGARASRSRTPLPDRIEALELL